MAVISAAQLIYTNVEEAQSPRGRRGSQTLLYTAGGLTPEEVREAEERLFYMAAPDPVIKRVFFPTRSGKIVLAQIVPLPGTDQYGRVGLSFAHALVFSREGFERLENDPFALFHDFPFLTTVDQALAHGDMKTGNIPAAHVPEDIKSRRPEPDLARILPADQIRRLLLLAAQADRLREENQAVSFTGQADAVFHLLEAVFTGIPRALRTRCSFDTFFVGGALNHLPYWAVGIPTGEPRKPNYLPFDMAQQRLPAGVDCAATTTWERWLEHELAKDPSGAVRDSTTAYRLAEWWDAQGGAGATTASPNMAIQNAALFRTFVSLNRPEMERRLRERLEQQVGTALAARLLPQALEWMQQEADEAVQFLQNGFERQMLFDWIYEAFEHSTPPEEPELDDLGKFLVRYPNPWLRLVWLRWERDWRGLAVAVRSLRDNDFQDFARWVLGTVSFRVEWSARRTDEGVIFGPVVGNEDEAVGDADPLVCALLGLRSGADPGSSAGFLKTGLNRLGFGKKEEPAWAQDPILPVNRERWLWLMTFLLQHEQDRRSTWTKNS